MKKRLKSVISGQSVYTTGVKAARSWLKIQEPNPELGQKTEEGDTSVMSHGDLAKLMSVFRKLKLINSMVTHLNIKLLLLYSKK